MKMSKEKEKTKNQEVPEDLKPKARKTWSHASISGKTHFIFEKLNIYVVIPVNEDPSPNQDVPKGVEVKEEEVDESSRIT